MGKRKFVVQACHTRAGWQDIPGEVFDKEFEAIRRSKLLKQTNPCVLRTFKKPKGWTPPETEK